MVRNKWMDGRKEGRKRIIIAVQINKQTKKQKNKQTNKQSTLTIGEPEKSHPASIASPSSDILRPASALAAKLFTILIFGALSVALAWQGTVVERDGQRECSLAAETLHCRLDVEILLRAGLAEFADTTGGVLGQHCARISGFRDKKSIILKKE